MFWKTKMQINLNIDTLVSENCLILGQKALSKKNNNKNIFILGNRNSIEIFKKNRIRFLLLKLYPLISGFYKTTLGKQDIKILFATTTQSYKQIIKETALLCGMSYSNDRWLCGSITAILRKTNDRFNAKQTREEQYIDNFYQKKYKKSIDITKSQNQLSNRWASLAIIPDIKNNPMILREINRALIPTAGIVNTNTNSLVTYPIFGNDESLISISFFCNLVAKLIVREKSLFSAKKKYNRSFGKKKMYINKCRIFKGNEEPYPLSRSRRDFKGSIAFWKYLERLVFSKQKKTKYVNHSILRKIKLKKQKLAKDSVKKIDTGNNINFSTKKETFFAHFNQKNYTKSFIISNARIKTSLLFNSLLVQKAWRTKLPINSEWIFDDKTLPKFSNIAKKTLFTRWLPLRKSREKTELVLIKTKYKLSNYGKIMIRKLKQRNKRLQKKINSLVKLETITFETRRQKKRKKSKNKRTIGKLKLLFKNNQKSIEFYNTVEHYKLRLKNKKKIKRINQIRLCKLKKKFKNFIQECKARKKNLLKFLRIIIALKYVLDFGISDVKKNNDYWKHYRFLKIKKKKENGIVLINKSKILKNDFTIQKVEIKDRFVLNLVLNKDFFVVKESLFKKKKIRSKIRRLKDSFKKYKKLSKKTRQFCNIYIFLLAVVYVLNRIGFKDLKNVVKKKMNVTNLIAFFFKKKKYKFFKIILKIFIQKGLINIWNLDKKIHKKTNKYKYIKHIKTLFLYYKSYHKTLDWKKNDPSLNLLFNKHTINLISCIVKKKTKKKDFLFIRVISQVSKAIKNSFFTKIKI